MSLTGNVSFTTLDNLTVVGSPALGPQAGQTGVFSPVSSTLWRPEGPTIERGPGFADPDQTVGLHGSLLRVGTIAV